MTTAGPITQAEKTVTVQDMQQFSLGQRTNKAGPLTAVPGLGNVVATFCIIPGPISGRELTVTIGGLARPRTRTSASPTSSQSKSSTRPRPSLSSGSCGSTAMADGARTCAWTSSSLTRWPTHRG